MPSNGHTQDPPNGAVNMAGRANHRMTSATRGNAPAKIAKRQPIRELLSPPPPGLAPPTGRRGCGCLAVYGRAGSRLAQGSLARAVARRRFIRPVAAVGTCGPRARRPWLGRRQRRPSRRAACLTLRAGLDVLVTNPRLVPTGLDLLDFPSVVWAEDDATARSSGARRRRVRARRSSCRPPRRRTAGG